MVKPILAAMLVSFLAGVAFGLYIDPNSGDAERFKKSMRLLEEQNNAIQIQAKVIEIQRVAIEKLKSSVEDWKKLAQQNNL